MPAELKSSIDFSQSLPSLKVTTEAIQFRQKDQPMVLLKDQEGINDEDVVFSLGAFLIALMLDGKIKLEQLHHQVTEKMGGHINILEIESLVNDLEKHFLLETPRLHNKRKEIWDTFMSHPVRPARILGKGYPKDHLELAEFMGKFFKDSKGPGKEFASTPIQTAPLRGLIVPHIDLHRGGPGYAWGYQKLSEYPAPDVVVALGVAHANPNSPWVMTEKEYQTPYGPMGVHQELYQDLAGRLWYDPAEEQWVHRNEHSLEFQALWLKYLWKEKTPEWIPILCSSFERFCPDKPPSTVPSIENALQSMGQAIINYEKSGKKVLILAGVDLAHVGPRFGDKEKCDAKLREKIEVEDKLSLAQAMNFKADDFYMSVVKDHHWRKVCGLSAIYTATRIINTATGDNKTPGQLLSYGQAEDPLDGTVSYASLAFERLSG